MKKLSLSIVTVHQRGDTKRLLRTRKHQRYFRRAGVDAKVLVVDDTFNKRRYSANDSKRDKGGRWQIVPNKLALGRHRSISKGVEIQTKPWVFIPFGDEDYSFDELSSILPFAAKADCLVLTRRFEPYFPRGHWKSLISGYWLYRLLGIKIHYPASAILVKKDAFKGYKFNLFGFLSPGAGLIRHAVSLGKKVEEVILSPRDESSSLDSNLPYTKDTKPLPKKNEQQNVWNGVWIYVFSFVSVVSVLVYGISKTVYGDKISINGGLGWDGMRYAQWARNFYYRVFERGLDSYDVQRLLPSAVVYHVLDWFTLPKTNHNVVQAFGIYNSVLLAGAAICWILISREIGLGLSGRVAAFVGFFINYPALAFAFYCPVMTDMTALFLGTLMIYLYLTNHRIWLGLATLAGGFVWPTAPVVGILLFIFPRKGLVPGGVSWKWLLPISGLAAGLYCYYGLFLYRSGAQFSNQWLYLPIRRPLPSEIYWSLAISTCFLFWAIRGAINNSSLLNPLTWWRNLSLGGLLSAFVIVGAIAWGRQELVLAERANTFSASGYLNYWGLSSFIRPGVILVGHATVYGPIFLMVCFCWSRASRAVHEYGLGLTLCLGAGILALLDSQSRHSINFLPIFVLAFAKVVDSLDWGKIQHLVFLGLSVFASTVWIRFNDDAQFYLWMHNGPAIRPKWYLAQSGIVLGGAILLYAICIFWPWLRQRQQMAFSRIELNS